MRGPRCTTGVLRALILLPLLLVLTAHANAQTEIAFRNLVDARADVAISLPSYLIPSTTQTERGTRWAAPDLSLSVELLKYPAGQTLEYLDQQVRKVEGRKLDRASSTDGSRMLVGKDADGSSFHIGIRTMGDETKGFLIRYQTKSQSELKPIAERIAKSFVPFPAACKAEDERLLAIVNKVAFEADGPTRRSVTEPLTISLSGLTDIGALKFRSGQPLTPVLAFEGSVLTERMDNGWRLMAARDVDGEPHIAQGKKRAVFSYFSMQGKVPDKASLTLVANTTGGISITPMFVARTVCGERVLSEAKAHTFLFEPEPREAALASAGGTMCAGEGELLKRLAAHISVEVETGKGVRAGEALTVRWRRGGEPFLPGRPIHIIVTTPEWVRFEGPHILPIPAGGRVPSNVAYGKGLMRVFIPLMTRAVPRESSFKIKPYRVGPMTIGHAIVSRTSCGETVLAQGASTTIEVVPGQAEVVIQDFFALEKPERTAISNDGRYRLEVFHHSYRVFEIASGIKIVDRRGIAPNFSPFVRFVAAYVAGDPHTGGDLEVVDLATGRPVLGLDATGPTVAWALHDALLIEGTMGHPELRIRRTLVDPERVVDPPNQSQTSEIGRIQVGVSGRGDSAWERFKVRLALDHGVVAIEHRSTSEGVSLRTDVFEIASGHRPGTFGRRLSVAGIIDYKGNSDPLSTDDAAKLLARYGVDSLDSPLHWDLGERLQLSHHSEALDERLDNATVRTPSDGTKRPDPTLPKQRVSLVAHGRGAAPVSAQPASSGPTAIRGVIDWRLGTLQPRSTNGTLTAATQFAEQLGAFGVCTSIGCSAIGTLEVPPSFVKTTTFPGRTFQYASQSTEFRLPPEEIEGALSRDAPMAAALMTGEPNRVCYQGGNRGDSVRFRMIADGKGHTDTHGVWRWMIGKKAHWLVQTVCSHAGILGSPVVLFVGTPGTEGRSFVLAHGDTASGRAEKLLHQDFRGAPNEALLRVRPFLVDERWLLIGSPPGASVAIVDLDEPDKPIVLRNVIDAQAIVQLMRSSDGENLVQLNSDGRFHIYGIKTGRHVISGRWIDDEIVLATFNGYYDGSYEGGQFVHLAFTGDAELYALAQFERVLRRPEIVKSVIEGAINDGPKPHLSVPPRAILRLDPSEPQPTARIALNAGTRLKKMRLFEDGQLLQEVDVTGREADVKLPVGRPLTGRWLSALAEDELGLVSAPSTVPSPTSAATNRTLHVVVVGVDTYKEERLTLSYARSDAKRLGAALRHRRGGYYREANVVELMDGAATADAIVQALESAITRAKLGDTVLFFFAGHGVRGSDGRYYLTPTGYETTASERTGLAWSRLARTLDKSKVRVVMVLDACHSGATGSEGIAANDQAASELLKGSRAPVIVFAASKGRQYSYEDEKGKSPKWGGGVFTHALVKVLTEDWRAYDQNSNGALEISEVYRALKGLVAQETSGAQTPWLVRQDVVGDFSLF